MAKIPPEILKRQAGIGLAYPVKERLVIQSAGAMSVDGSFNDTEMSERCVISDDGIDRVGDVVISTGCDYANYATAPVVFFNHQSDYYPLPVAYSWDLSLPLDQRRCSIKVEEHKVTAKVWYSRSTPEGAIFYQLVCEGMRGKSVGYNPKSDPVRLPTGGYRYDEWELLEFSSVGVPCNPGATTSAKAFADRLRGHLDRGKIAGERLSPTIRKCLEPLAAQPRRNWSQGWRKPKAEPWGAFTAPAGFAEELLARAKALNSTSGTAGGYTIMADTSEHTDEAHLSDPKEQLKTAIEGVCNEHLGNEAEGHVVHFHPETGQVHHAHPAEYDGQKLAKIKEALEGVDGVTGVTQEPEKSEPPPGEGWEHAFGIKDKDMRPDDDSAGEANLTKQAVKFVKGLPPVALKWYLAGFRAKASSSLQECVSEKIPKIAEDHPEMDADQREAVAYSMCGEKKAMSQPEPEVGGTNPQEDTADEPHDVSHAKKIIGLHVKAMNKFHPKAKEFYKAMCHGIKEFTHDEYGHDLGKMIDETGAQQDQEQWGEDKTDEELSAYKSLKPLALKRIMKKTKRSHFSMMKAAAECLEAFSKIKPGETWGADRKSAAAVQFMALQKMIEELESGREVPASETPVKEEPALDIDALAAQIGKGFFNEIKPDLYKVTGKREHKPEFTKR